MSWEWGGRPDPRPLAPSTPTPLLRYHRAAPDLPRPRPPSLPGPPSLPAPPPSPPHARPGRRDVPVVVEHHVLADERRHGAARALVHLAVQHAPRHRVHHVRRQLRRGERVVERAERAAEAGRGGGLARRQARGDEERVGVEVLELDGAVRQDLVWEFGVRFERADGEGLGNNRGFAGEPRRPSRCSAPEARTIHACRPPPPPPARPFSHTQARSTTQGPPPHTSPPSAP